MTAQQPAWQRIVLLTVLGYEGAGALSGGGLLVAAPDGRLMDMPMEIVHGFFADFLVPGAILMRLGVLAVAALVFVWRRAPADWLTAGLSLAGSRSGLWPRSPFCGRCTGCTTCGDCPFLRAS
jgi:hypothetical protein